MVTSKTIQKTLKQEGYLSAFASLEDVKMLKSDIEFLRQEKKLDPKIDGDYLNFQFKIPKEYHSIIIVSCPLPNHTITVEKNQSNYEVILPTVYFQKESAEKFERHMDGIFKHHAIRYEKVLLPLKLLAARRGLSTYGKNNLSYVEGFGSYHKLTAYLTTMPIEQTQWLPIQVSPSCHACQICTDACPNHLIGLDDPIIDAGHCITFPNEIQGDFPNWIQAKDHNALMGCIRCQENCPMNLAFKDNKVHLAHFSQADVQNILHSDTYEALKENMQEKVKALEFHRDYSIFKRNFMAVYQNL